jgi:hypothetical protein
MPLGKYFQKKDGMADMPAKQGQPSPPTPGLRPGKKDKSKKPKPGIIGHRFTKGSI